VMGWVSVVASDARPRDRARKVLGCDSIGLGLGLFIVLTY
jgi:hypothetical protein